MIPQEFEHKHKLEASQVLSDSPHFIKPFSGTVLKHVLNPVVINILKRHNNLNHVKAAKQEFNVHSKGGAGEQSTAFNLK